MVVFLFPSGMANSDTLGMQLYRTKTLYGMLPVRDDRKAVVLDVLRTGVKVVIPDVPEARNDVWHDVLLALRALHHPVQRMGDYLQQCNQPTPPPPAAPPATQGGGVGQHSATA
jgi:hypothetical protein